MKWIENLRIEEKIYIKYTKKNFVFNILCDLFCDHHLENSTKKLLNYFFRYKPNYVDKYLIITVTI